MESIVILSSSMFFKYIQYYMKTDLYIMKKNMRAEAFKKYWRHYIFTYNNEYIMFFS